MRITNRSSGAASTGFGLVLAFTFATPAGMVTAEEGRLASTLSAGMSAADIVDAITSSRERLHSGSCRARWKWKTNAYEEAADWTFYFDYDKGWTRIERHLINRPRDIIRITTPVEAIDYVPGPSGTITRLPPNAPALKDGYAFDIRIAGLAALISVKGNAATWDNFLAMIKRDGEPIMRAESDGKLKLTWETTIERSTREGKLIERSGHSFWLDPRMQYSPVRAEFFSGAAKEAVAAEIKLFGIVETEWAERDGAPVPLRCAWTLPLHDQTAELSFEWISVNRSVRGDLFTPEGLNAPKGTQIVNSKLGESFIESIVGDEPPVREASRPTANPNKMVAIGGGAVLAVVGIVCLGRRVSTARRADRTG